MAENKYIYLVLSSLLLLWYIFFHISTPPYFHVQLKLTSIHNTLSSSYSPHNNNLVGWPGLKEKWLAWSHPDSLHAWVRTRNMPPTEILTHPLHLGPFISYSMFRRQRVKITYCWIRLYTLPVQHLLLSSFSQTAVQTGLGKSINRTCGLMLEITH